MSEYHNTYYRELNICRGICVLLVVLGHVVTQTSATGATALFFDAVGDVIYSFHMPLFFALSGFLAAKLFTAERASRLQYCKTRCLRLLVPYVVMGLLYTPFRILLAAYSRSSFQVYDLWKILIGENPDGALWFLYVLFLIGIALAIALRKKTYPVLMLLTFVLCIVSYFFNDSDATPCRLLRFPFYFLIGLSIRLYYEKFTRALRKKWTCFLLLAIFVAGNVLYRTMHIDLLLFFTSLSGICLLWQESLRLCSRMQTSVEKEDASSSHKRYFWETLGDYGMDIYIFSEPIKVALRVLTGSILGWGAWPVALICFAGALLLPIPLSKNIVQKIPVLRILFLGKR